MRYTGHLDLHRTWERTIRRAQLPLAYSQGFNPRPKLNLAAALPLGFTSNCELAEIWLNQDHPETEIASRLQAAAPPGIEILQIETVDPKAPKIPNLIDSAKYEIILLENISDLDIRIEKIRTAESLIRERRGKEYDLRPLIESIEIVASDSAGEQKIHLQLAARTGATGRPDEVLAVLEIPPYNARVQRTDLILKTT
jgi:radical SAM-linked protein